MVINHRYADFLEKIQKDAAAFLITADETEFVISESRGKNSYGQRRWFLLGTGKRCSFNEPTLELAIETAKAKLAKHLIKLASQPQGTTIE